MEDERNWIWIYCSEAMGIGFDEFICHETKEIKQVWDDGYIEIYRLTF